jgi:DNA-binding HxlR family transcriptional regulator
MRFSDLERTIPNITQKMLGQQLRSLTAEGIAIDQVIVPANWPSRYADL